MQQLGRVTFARGQGPRLRCWALWFGIWAARVEQQGLDSGSGLVGFGLGVTMGGVTVAPPLKS